MFEGGQQEPIGTLVVFFLGNSSCRSPIRQTLLQTRPRFENCCFANSAYFRNNHFHSWEELKIFGDPAAFFCRWGTEMWADQVTCWGHVVHLWQNSEPRVWPSVFWSPGPGDVTPCLWWCYSSGGLQLALHHGRGTFHEERAELFQLLTHGSDGSALGWSGSEGVILRAQHLQRWRGSFLDSH